MSEFAGLWKPSMHSRLGSVTLSQLAFPGEGNPNFPWGKLPLDSTVVKSELKSKSPVRESCLDGWGHLVSRGPTVLDYSCKPKRATVLFRVLNQVHGERCLYNKRRSLLNTLFWRWKWLPCSIFKDYLHDSWEAV